MTFALERRYPLEPLLALLPPDVGDSPEHDRSAVRMLAEAIGVAPRSVQRWQQGGIPEDSADRAACALGLHMALIWDTYREDIEAAA